MSDNGNDFDLCSCINHDLAMKRLLSILRQSQAYCTDNECLTVSRLPGPGNAPNNSDFMTLCLFLIIGMLLYVLRSQFFRQFEDDIKTRDNDSGSDGEPPLPPPTVN